MLHFIQILIHFKRRTLPLLCLICFSGIIQKSFAQPFLDLLHTSYTTNPGRYFGKSIPGDKSLTYLNVSTTLPILLKNKKDAIVLSPFFEKWATTTLPPFAKSRHYGAGLPVSLFKSSGSEHWSFVFTLIPRINTDQFNNTDKFQLGGAIQVNYKTDSSLTYKFGIYINDDLFGLFVMPLGGIDWRIDRNNSLFGVLPGNLKYEHRFSNIFYGGGSFRAITNSYSKGNEYWRIDENEAGLFTDVYFSKNLVLNLEGGHSISRRIRTGTSRRNYVDWQMKDDFYIRTGLVVRLRLDRRREGNN
ncbi:MAG TPA: hypothetical protein VM012_15780 [Flavitalea sp.]|nr:hypothetical protein [Flavitalea sp.]